MSATGSRKVSAALPVAIPVLLALACASAPHWTDARSTSPDRLRGITWAWQGTAAPSPVRVAEPARYTLRLADEGRAQLRLDCNRGGGAYALSEGSLSFGPLMSTRMACPPDSQDQVFAEQLSRVRSFFLEGDALFLELGDGAGTMRFLPEPGGS